MIAADVVVPAEIAVRRRPDPRSAAPRRRAAGRDSAAPAGRSRRRSTKRSAA